MDDSANRQVNMWMLGICMQCHSIIMTTAKFLLRQAKHLGLPEFSPTEDRVMICGSIGLNTDIKALLEARGFSEGTNSTPGASDVELAFVG